MSVAKNKDHKWNSLRKCWIGYKIAKNLGNTQTQIEYAKKIVQLSKDMHFNKIPVFPELNQS